MSVTRPSAGNPSFPHKIYGSDRQANAPAAPQVLLLIMRAVAVATLLAAGLLLPDSARAAADDACAQTISRSASRYESSIHKALADCAVKSATGSECDTANRDERIAKASARLATGVSSCTDADLSALGFPAACDDESGGTFSSVDLAACIQETHRTAIEAAVDIEVPGPPAPVEGDEARCQKKIAKTSQTFLKKNLVARQRCLTTAGTACFEERASTGDANTDAKLTDGESDLTDALASACDGANLGALGFPGDCSAPAPFDTNDLAACLIETHDAISRALLEYEHPGEAPATTTTTTTTTTLDEPTTTTTTTLPSMQSLIDAVAPYGDADGDGFSNNVELAACSNPADAASTPLNDHTLCANQTIFSDTLGDSWGSTNQQLDPTYTLAVNLTIAQNAADCGLYCASAGITGSPQACVGAWPWSGDPEYARYAAGHTVEVNFPDEDGNGLHGTIFLPPGVECTPGDEPICDGVTDAVTCTAPGGATYPAVVICDGFVGSQRMYYWAGQRLAEQGFIAMAFDVSGQGLSQGEFPNGDAGIADGVDGGVGGGFSRDQGAAMNFLVSAANPVRDLIRVDPTVIVNQAPGAEDHFEPYVLGLAGHSAGATAAIAYQQSTSPAYPVRARAVVAWSHFDANGTIGNVPIQLHSGDNDNGFIQPPSEDNRCPEMQARYDRLGGDRNLDGTTDFVKNNRQIIMTEAGTHLDYSHVPFAYTPVWDEDVEYHYTLAWFDRYLNGNIRRRMGNVTGGVVQSVNRYTDYAPCDSGSDCFSADERLKMSHAHLSNLWCSRYDVGGASSASMKGGACAVQ
jgi:dienelactone hydrolase